MHILEVGPDRVRIVSERALNEGVGRETVSSIAQRKNAIAAVNAGFFTIGGRYDGEPDGLLKIRNEWFSDSTIPRGVIAWKEKGTEVHIGQLSLRYALWLDGRSYPVDGINRLRGPAERILYTWAFHRSTLTDPLGTEILIAKDRVVAVHSAAGDSPIPVTGLVYSIGPEANIAAGTFKPNQRTRISRELMLAGSSNPSDGRQWEQMDFIVGGLGVLVRNGDVVTDHSDQKVRQGFITDRHPRTAVGIREDGTWVILVVDGRQPELSKGMTLAELAELMKSLGCRNALNLDGGGSSTFYYQGHVLNSPSDGRERPVSDAIIFFAR